MQTVQTQIRLQSDQGLHCLPYTIWFNPCLAEPVYTLPEANRSGSALFVIQNVNLYQQINK